MVDLHVTAGRVCNATPLLRLDSFRCRARRILTRMSRKPYAGIREAAAQGCRNRVLAGAIPIAVFLPRGKRGAIRLGRDDTWAVYRGACFRRQRATRCQSSHRYLKSARTGCITIQQRSWMQMAHCLGLYRKMHIPDDPLYFEKFYFTPGDSGSIASTRVTPALATWCVGTNGIRKAARITSCKARMYCSIRLRSGGIHPRRSGMEQRSWTRGGRFSARMRSLMEYRSRSEPIGYEGPPESGLEFWGNSFVADPFGQVIVAGFRDQEEVLVAECDPEENGRSAAKLAVSSRPAHRCVWFTQRWLGSRWSVERVLSLGSACRRNGSARSDLDRLAAREDGLAG